jgi:hypothetical protein
MCLIVGKYLKGTGWVLAKNRDQDYVPNVTFRDEKNSEVGEILVMYDHDIDYQEGMNDDGLVILSTSLTPTLTDEINDKDGENIYKALHLKQKDAAKFLVKQKMTGYIFLATPETLIVIEAARTNGGTGEYKHTIRYIPKTETIVRTNHGIDLPWGGFQYGVSEFQDFRRKSSEMRKAQTEEVMQYANTPEEMMDALASRMNDDLQFNLFRVENKPRQMRTVFQWVMVPSQRVALVRPIQTKMTLRVSKEDLHIVVLDNDIIGKIYKGRLKRLSQIKYEDDTYKTVVKENLFTFNQYIYHLS